MRPNEATLNATLAKALLEDQNFAQWLLNRTCFASEAADCVFCRSDNPWGKVRLPTSSTNGDLTAVARECETDVLAIFETNDKRRLGLHIENKLANGRFTPHQPELYRERIHQWMNRPNLGMYSKATSVLIAPQKFFDRWRKQAEIFESFVSHEEIAIHLPLFRP